MFKKRSKVLMTVVCLEVILSIWSLFYFNYLDRLTYSESIVNTPSDLAILIQNMYTNSWWALIILTVCLSTIFSLGALIYRELKFQFMAIMLWFVLFILAIDYKASFGGLVSTVSIFTPIITVNIIAYFEQKKLIS